MEFMYFKVLTLEAFMSYFRQFKTNASKYVLDYSYGQYDISCSVPSIARLSLTVSSVIEI